MEKLLSSTKKHLKKRAYASFKAKEIFNDEQLNRMNHLVDVVPKKKVTLGDVGDDNNLLVGRFMNDEEGKCPQVLNGEMGEEMVSILNASFSQEYFSKLLGKDYFIRRCQANILTEGSHIGTHIDTYSNMNYIFSIVVQFGKEYGGGEFYVNHDGKEEFIKTAYGDILINKCEIPHGVKKVDSGHRKTLVFFLSDQPPEVPNTENHQIEGHRL